MFNHVVSCSDGQLRLTDSNYKDYEYVEICSDQRWGTFSISNWTDENTIVACTELGYRGICKIYYCCNN